MIIAQLIIAVAASSLPWAQDMGCERLKAEFANGDLANLVLVETDEPKPSAHETYVVHIGSNKIPIPVERYERISYMGTDAGLGMVGITTEAGDTSILFSFTYIPEDFSDSGWAYEDLLKIGFSTHVSEIDCSAPASEWVPMVLGIFVKSFEAPTFPIREMYRANWGWLFGGERHGRFLWRARYRINENQFLNVIWVLPKELADFGTVVFDQESLEGGAPKALEDLARCIERDSGDCLEKIKSIEVKNAR